MRLVGIKEDPPKSGVFKIRFRDQNGRDRAEWCKGLEAAQARLKLRHQQVDDKTFRPDMLGRWKEDPKPDVDGVEQPKAKLIADLIDEVVAEAKVTITTWKEDERFGREWKAELGTRRVDEVTVEDVLRWRRRRLAEPHKTSPATCNRYVTFLQKVLRYGVDCGHIARNPLRTSSRLGGGGTFRKLEERGKDGEQILLPEVQARLQTVMTPFDFCIVVLAVETGLRGGNLFGLRREWIDLGRRVIRVPWFKFKTRRERIVKLNSLAVELLTTLLAEHDCEWVFPAQRSQNKLGHLSENAWVRRRWNPAFDALGLPHIRFHACRGTMATRMLEAGATLEEVREQGGWSTLAMVQRYARIVDAHRDATLERMAESSRRAIDASAIKPPEVRNVSDSVSDKNWQKRKPRQNKENNVEA